MNKFNSSKLYRLEFDDGHYYIGSTTNKLINRFSSHIVSSRNSSSKGLYAHMKEVEPKSVKIILISEHCLENGEQLRKLEDDLIRQHKDDGLCLNINGSYWSKEMGSNYHKEHYLKNKQHILDYHKEYQKDNNKYKEYQKQYRDLNRTKINNKKSEWNTYVQCICGSNILKEHKNRHEHSAKHIKFIEIN